jgi:hypothetical protein
MCRPHDQHIHLSDLRHVYQEDEYNDSVACTFICLISFHERILVGTGNIQKAAEETAAIPLVQSSVYLCPTCTLAAPAHPPPPPCGHRRSCQDVRSQSIVYGTSCMADII